MAEDGTVRAGEVSIAYVVERRPRRRKTLEMRMEGALSVRIAAPPHAPLSAIEAFIRDRAGWILRRGEQFSVPEPVQRDLPERVPYRGRELRLRVEESAGECAGAMLDRETLEISLREGLQGKDRRAAVLLELDRWYQDQAPQVIAEAIARWEPRLKRTPKRVFIRRQKRRWGSCAPDGSLRFNWKLVTLAPDLLEYVVVHELVHLEVMNHSRAFWGRVGELLPDYGARRKRLRAAEGLQAR